MADDLKDSRKQGGDITPPPFMADVIADATPDVTPPPQSKAKDMMANYFR